MDPQVSLKHFDYFFDPAPLDEHSLSKHLFPFLQEASTASNSCPDNSYCFDPRDMDLPWSTTFPATMQCKHWRDAQSAAVQFFEQIKSAAQNKASETPHGDDTLDKKKANKRDMLLVDTAISAPMYMFPAANANQARLLAKGSLLIAIHDGKVYARCFYATTYGNLTFAF